MDLSFTAEELAFRDEARRFFRTEIPQSIRDKVAEGEGLTRDDMITSQRILNARGWATVNWPVQWGGQDWSPVQVYMYQDEMQQANVPTPIGFNVTMVGPVIAQFGSDEQKQQFLPKTANADIFWCQGFSEPGSGSDLASLRTRAERKGDKYIINGQKIWTTLAQYADWIFCLVRTDPAAKKQEGISFILVDMKTPGITVRPDRHHRRRPRGERGVLRQRRSARREPGRPGEQGLGLRQVPAGQRAHRHRPGRRLEGEGGAHQGTRVDGARRRSAVDRGPALPREARRGGSGAEGAGDDAVARRGRRTQAREGQAEPGLVDPEAEGLA